KRTNYFVVISVQLCCFVKNFIMNLSLFYKQILRFFYYHKKSRPLKKTESREPVHRKPKNKERSTNKNHSQNRHDNSPGYHALSTIKKVLIIGLLSGFNNGFVFGCFVLVTSRYKNWRKYSQASHLM